jgi:hypothetical protein
MESTRVRTGMHRCVQGHPKTRHKTHLLAATSTHSVVVSLHIIASSTAVDEGQIIAPPTDTSCQHYRLLSNSSTCLNHSIE